MTKHVFWLNRHGSIHHEGKFVKETDKTVTYLNFRSTERRMNKGADCAVVETDDPESVCRAWRDAWGAYDTEISEAIRNLELLRDQQRASAVSAILGPGPR